MRFKSVKVENFMSFGEAYLELDKPGLHLVLGINKDSEQFDSNGSGKSGLFDAIIWCLYGSVLRGVSIDSLVRNGEERCTVTVVFNNDGNDITITRTRIINKKSILDVYDGAGMELFPADSVTHKQELINAMLGLDFRTFTNSVYFGKGLSQFFMVADDETRKNILEAILQLIDFDTAYGLVKVKYKEVNDFISDSKRVIELTDNGLELKTKSYDLLWWSYDEEKISSTPEIKKLTEELGELDKKEFNYDTKVLEINTKISTMFDKYNGIKKAIDKEIAFENNIVENSCKTKLAKVEQSCKYDIDKLSFNYEKLLETFKKEEEVLLQQEDSLVLIGNDLTDKKFNYKNKIDSLENKRFNLESLSSGAICELCQAIITEEHRYEVLSAIDEELVGLVSIRNDINKSLDKYLTDNRNIKGSLNKIAHSVKEAGIKFNSDKLTKLSLKQEAMRTIDESKFVDFASIRERYTNRLTQEFEAYSSITDKLKVEEANLTAEWQQLSSRKSLINTTISTLEGNLRRLEFLLKDTDREISELESKKKDYESSIKSSIKELEALAFWVEAFSQKGISSFIFETTLPELSSRANYYSTNLTGGSIRINILPTTPVKSTGATKEKLNVVVTNSLGATSYEGCSEGEKRRVDLCLLLALQDLVSSRGTKTWDTAFFDEVFDTLDNTGIASVIDLLRTESPKKSIYLISHNNDLKNFFDSAIFIKKENGVSTICT